MPKPPLPEGAPEPTETSLEDSFYEVPAELREPPPLAAHEAPGATPPDATTPEDDASEDDADEAPRIRRGSSAALKVAIALAVVLAVGAVILVVRARERARAVNEGIAKAEALMRADTAEGYRRAAALLEPHAQLDPLQAASARAFALAMLAADYRDTEAEAEANALLVVPGRADSIPRHASLAFAALALGKNVLGDATSALGAAADTRWGDVLQARIALRAGTMDAALDPASAAAAEEGFAPGLAIHGDVARRARRDAPTARAAYEAALAVSPTHPRAAYGMAKLALSGQAPVAEAEAALQRLLADRPATPAHERARAALHLVALRLRAGDATGDALLDDAALDLGLDEAARSWARRAAATEAANHSAYRAVSGAPPALESASDDDPGELRPEPLRPPPPAPEPPRVEPPRAEPHPSAAKPGKHTVKPVHRIVPKSKGTAAHGKAKQATKAGAAAKKKAATRGVRR